MGLIVKYGLIALAVYLTYLVSHRIKNYFLLIVIFIAISFVLVAVARTLGLPWEYSSAGDDDYSWR